jgi:TrmH family RNA methyltransferase
LALDGLNDPGNLGTIIRIADWYGIKDIVCSLETVDFYNPKVINSSKGSFTRVNVYYTQLDRFLTEIQLPILASCMNGTSIYKLDNQLPCVLLMGSEANGIQKHLLKLASKEISIPRVGVSESLNVGVATGILIDRLLN